MRVWFHRAHVLAWAFSTGLGTTQAQSPVPNPPLPQKEPATPIVAATVNGEPIPLERVDAFIKNKLSIQPLTPAQTHQLRTDVVAEFVDELLVQQFLRDNGPKIELSEIDRHLKAFTDTLSRQGKTLSDFLRETNQTEASLRASWIKHLQLDGYVKKQISEEQLKKYYEANKEVFDQTEVKVSHIVIRVGPKTPDVERAAARKRLKMIRAELVAGTIDFAIAAKKHSECPSAPDGGNLGFIPRKGGLLEESFAKAAFALKVGEVSEIVETDYGIHLIKVTERKPGIVSTYEKCIEDVRDAVAEEVRNDLVKKLRKQARIDITVP